MRGEVKLVVRKGNKVYTYSQKNLIFYQGKSFLLRSLLLGDPNPRYTKWYVQIGSDNTTSTTPDQNLSSLIAPLTEKRVYFIDEFWNPDVTIDLTRNNITFTKTFLFNNEVSVGEVGLVVEDPNGNRILFNRATFSPAIRMLPKTSLTTHITITFI